MPAAKASVIPPSLAPYFTGLWGLSPQLAVLAETPSGVDVPQRPVLSGRLGAEPVLHLPWAAVTSKLTDHPAQIRWAQAAASHAAAHWRFGRSPIARGKLKPVQLALLGVLEDACVESLAIAQLPGLREVWLPFHAGPEDAQGSGFEALLGRLARSLLDLNHHDPHPWVARARAMFFATDGVTPVLQTAEAVRQVASVLGNDIGQMRLPFNPRTYRVHAAYRDDNSHLWSDDPELTSSDTPLEASGGVSVNAQPFTPQPDAAEALPNSVRPQGEQSAKLQPSVFRYHEWDQRIGRYRPDWCCVVTPAAAQTSGMEPSLASVSSRRLQNALSDIGGKHAFSGRRLQEGDELHVAALIDARVDQRLQRPPDLRIYRRTEKTHVSLSVLVLIDASQSTDLNVGEPGTPLLHQIRMIGYQTVAALQGLGHRSSLWAFASYGRQRIEMTCIKSWREPAQGATAQKGLAAIRSGGSTRAGPAVRHAAVTILADATSQSEQASVILLVTDGQLHDSDVHEPGYLAKDLQRACWEVRRTGVKVGALCVGENSAADLTAALGQHAWRRVNRSVGLILSLPALLGGLL